MLESESLFKKAKVLTEASFLEDDKLDFFGFNGTNAFYNKDFVLPSSSEFINESFYSHKRRLFRLRFDLQKYLLGSKLRLLTGFTFNYFYISPRHVINTAGGGNLSGNSMEPTLFDLYQEWGVINATETKGGDISLITLGLIYDTRNDPCYCTNGKWFELMLVHSSGFLSDQSFSKVILTYRQHNSILNDKLTFSFRLSSQQKLGGNIPFYMVPTFFDSRLSRDGVGGAFNLRGALRNRIASDGFVTGNFEIKFNTLDFNIAKQQFSAITSLFYDNAYVTQPYKVNINRVPNLEKEIHFNAEKQKIHHTLGIGLYLVFNKNNIISVNYGFTTNKQLGSTGLYIGSSLLF